MGQFAFWTVIFALAGLCDLGIGVAAFRSGKKGIWLGMLCMESFAATAVYLVRPYVRDYFAFSVLTSVYCILMDFVLYSLILFSWNFASDGERKRPRWFFILFAVCMAGDAALLAVNPYREIVMRFLPFDGHRSMFYTRLLPLAYLHGAFVCMMIGVSLFYLLRKGLSVPSIYGEQYRVCAGVISICGLLKLGDLLFEGGNLHLSLIGLTIAAFFLYWYCFQYASHGLIARFQNWFLENVDQGLVVFDYEDRLVMHNKKAEQMLPGELYADRLPLPEFVSLCGLNSKKNADLLPRTSLCFVGNLPLRCDYSIHTDKDNRRLGRLFVFSHVATEFDMLTGFHSWVDFKENADTLFPADGHKYIVATCDINSLAAINRRYGRVVGDRAIQCMAEGMRTEFPDGTVFTRSREASIAAVCRDTDMAAVEGFIRRVQERLAENDLIDGPIQLQSSVSIRGDESVVDTIRRNLQSMSTKKLMDRTSIHSEMLRSLLQALTQCDPETSAHVERTQRSGAALGRRIGLTDQQQSNLALLAILHDIGKIGIPLEILNKPGKLTDAEWKMLQTHTEKGYQIAKTSQELSGIADMILGHHERWDGKGYPLGLREAQIPLLSRVIAVVDSYDAMTNDRAYRKALSESAARSELRRCAGTQFDPNIVRVFLQMLEENDRKQGVTVATMSQQEPKTEDEFSTGQVPVQNGRNNVHAMAYSMYVVGTDDFRIIQVDDRFETMTGYSREDVEARGLTQLSLIYEEDREEYMAMIRSILAQNTDGYLKHRLRCKDGEAIYVYCYGHSYYDSAVGEGRTRIVIINSDDPLQKD